MVLDGVETLLGLGDTDPLLGERTEFDPDAGDVVEPTYFALIDKPESEIDPKKFWVSDNQLLYGTSFADAKPERSAGYVLYSLLQSPERSDVNELPFYLLYEQVKTEAAKPDPASWLRAKEHMKALYQSLVISPDLIPNQVRTLTNNYINEMKQLHQLAIGIGALRGENRIDIGLIDESRFDEILNIISDVEL